jgi:hypothetical protein
VPTLYGREGGGALMCIGRLTPGPRRAGPDGAERRARAGTPSPSRTKWTRRVPHPVLIGHAAQLRRELPLDADEYLLSLPHTARKYWEHPVPKHVFPVQEDGTFRPCDKGQAFQASPPPPSRTKWTRLVHPSVLTGHVFQEGRCVPCDREDGLCDDDVMDETPGAEYAPDLTIFIRRGFEPKPYEEHLRYRLVGSI